LDRAESLCHGFLPTQDDDDMRKSLQSGKKVLAGLMSKDM